MKCGGTAQNPLVAGRTLACYFQLVSLLGQSSMMEANHIFFAVLLFELGLSSHNVMTGLKVVESDKTIEPLFRDFVLYPSSVVFMFSVGFYPGCRGPYYA